MDDLKKGFEIRKIRDSSARMYVSYLNRVSEDINGTPYNSNEFLKDFDKVKLFLSKLSNSIQKNMVSAILVAITKSKLVPVEGFVETYELYNRYLKGLYTATEKVENQKNIRECNNWLEWDDIIKITDIKRKIIKSVGLNSTSKSAITSVNFELLQQYVILSLYTMLPPKRLEYGDMEIINEIEFNKLSDKEKEKTSYLVIYSKVKKYFAFGIDRLKSHNNIDIFEKIEIPKDLNKVLNVWLNYNKSKYLLLNEHGNMLTRNGLTRQLLKIFEPYGKSISSQMLRKVYLSEMNKDMFERQAKEVELCRKMNHSRKIAETHYIKRI